MSTFFIADKASGMPSMVTSYLPCRDTDKASPGMLPWQHPTFLAVINDKASPRMPSVLLHFAVADSPVDKSFKGPDDFQGDQPRRPSEGERQSFPLVLLAGCPALLDKISFALSPGQISFAFVPWTNKFCIVPWTNKFCIVLLGSPAPRSWTQGTFASHIVIHQNTLFNLSVGKGVRHFKFQMVSKIFKMALSSSGSTHPFLLLG